LRTRILLIVFVLYVLRATLVDAQTIESVSVEGASRIDPETVLLQVESTTGSQFAADEVSADIKAVYRTGYFETVRVERAPGSAGGLDLIFIVREKPSIRNIYFKGNEEISDDTLKEVLGVEERKFFDREKILESVRGAEAFYEAKGYYRTSISYDSEEVGENLVDLIYEVKEGGQRRIEELVFEGNNNISASDLKSVVQTRPYAWYKSWITGSGVASEQIVEQDRRAISRHYLENGYATIRVDEPEIREVEDGVAVVFKVVEGPLFSFGKIDVSGDLVEGDLLKTLEDTEVVSGETFNIDLLRKDTFTITGKFTDVGYAFANVEPATNVNPGSGTVDVKFIIDRGDKVKVNRINFFGNDKTRDNVLRRALKVGEREEYSSSKIERSQVLLQRTGYFEEVSITPSPTQRADEVDLDIRVREGQTGTFSVGAGVSSGDGVLFSTRVTENNLFGSGNSLSVDINTGTRRENYVLSFNNPRINDTWWSGGIDLLAVQREFDDFDRSQAGGSITVGYPLWFLGPEYLEDIRFSLRYEGIRIKIDEVTEDAPQLIMDEEGRTTSSSLTPRLVRNTIDNPLSPTTGSRQSMSVEVSGLGLEERFWLAQASNTFYYPFYEASFGDFVFAHRVNFGWGENYEGDDTFPLFRRFFPGGINSVRGFEARELGPKNDDGNEFGGNKQLVSNFELILPLLSESGLNLLLFYDIGNAFDDEESIEFDGLRQSVGWGIRWRSPIAPIRIEIGYPLDSEEGESSVVTHFSFGAPR